jgi:hypothetical protein
MNVWFLLIILLWLPGVAQAVTTGPTANPYRAYPPSCLADPLPSVPQGPSAVGLVPMRTVVLATGSAGPIEDVVVAIYRTPCSSGTSAMLAHVERATTRLDVVVILPQVEIAQGGVVLPTARLSNDPNTVRSSDFFSVSGYGFLAGGETYVFENWPEADIPQINYNQSLTVTLKRSGLQDVSIAVPAYNPASYPEASQSIPVSGYLSGAYYDPAHSGEGMMIEVNEASATSRYIFMAWYTYDASGVPFWISGTGFFSPGDRSVRVDMIYTFGGGFAGGFPSSGVSVAPWGSITLDFPNCNIAHFRYQANSDLPSGVPSGSGSKSWARLTSINGLNCE